MAGSMTWRSYTGDDGSVYSIKIDESNASAVIGAGTVPLVPLRTVTSPGIPKYVRPRYANVSLIANPLVRRRFVVGTAAQYALLAQGATLNTEAYPAATGAVGVSGAWTVNSLRGEISTVPPLFNSVDTGLNDGDTAQ